MKEQILLKKIGNKNVEVRILKVDGGVIHYNFAGSRLELDQLADDWAISIADIADHIIQTKNAENLFRLSVFCYANGAYELSTKYYKESVSKGLKETGETKDLYRRIEEDYSSFVGFKLDEYFANVDSAIRLNNKDRARSLLNELTRRYGQTAVYKERKSELDEYYSKLKE